jgi:hypothetical protein
MLTSTQPGGQSLWWCVQGPKKYERNHEPMPVCQATDARQACDALQPSGAFHQDCGPDPRTYMLLVRFGKKTVFSLYGLKISEHTFNLS